MSFRVLWSDSALDRAAQLFDFIAEESPAVARRVIEDLFDRVKVLSDFPQLGRRLSEEIDSSLRRLVVGSYITVYQVEEGTQTITVVAVRHFREKTLAEEEP
ncbi:MAG: type II toxin-antitoxin system RelE/ParE family toxin [Acidobacteriota bacterium]